MTASGTSTPASLPLLNFITKRDNHYGVFEEEIGRNMVYICGYVGDTE